MDKKQILNAVKKVREISIKRKFNQSFDLIVNLKNLNLKKPEENVNAFIVLKKKGKKGKIGCLVGPELVNKAKEDCDVVIPVDKFPDYSDKKKIKKLAKEIEFFIAQADLMPKIAAAFGKVLGPMGKMPNPKAGCVVPKSIPTLKPIVEKLNNTIRLQTKSEQIVKCIVGMEDMKDEEIVDNIMQIYDYLIQHLPQEKNNVGNMFLKLTMSKSVLVGDKQEVKKAEKIKGKAAEENSIQKEKEQSKVKEEKANGKSS